MNFRSTLSRQRVADAQEQGPRPLRKLSEKRRFNELPEVVTCAPASGAGFLASGAKTIPSRALIVTDRPQARHAGRAENHDSISMCAHVRLFGTQQSPGIARNFWRPLDL